LRTREGMRQHAAVSSTEVTYVGGADRRALLKQAAFTGLETARQRSSF
jgi:hypothetical protein